MPDWKHALDVISNVLGVVSSAGSMPGVNLIPYVSTIASAATAINEGLKVGVKVLPYINAVKDTFAHGLPTPDQLSALDAKIADLQAIVQAPLPEREGDEPE